MLIACDSLLHSDETVLYEFYHKDPCYLKSDHCISLLLISNCLQFHFRGGLQNSKQTSFLWLQMIAFSSTYNEKVSIKSVHPVRGPEEIKKNYRRIEILLLLKSNEIIHYSGFRTTQIQNVLICRSVFPANEFMLCKYLDIILSDCLL